MRHAAHKAPRFRMSVSALQGAVHLEPRFPHRQGRSYGPAGKWWGAVVGLEPAVAEKLNEVAPMSRRAMREAARAAGRRSAFMASASLAALVGTAATAMAVGQQNASE